MVLSGTAATAPRRLPMEFPSAFPPPGVPDPYRPRIVDAELQEQFRSAAVLLIEGPKACGKTATARRAAASEVFLDADPKALEAARTDPWLVLEGPKPRLLDEWQVAPELWNPVRRAADLSGKKGQFLLTGSAVPPDDLTRHTGAGRIARVRMRPMSLFELGLSTGEVSLGDLIAGGRVSVPAPDIGVPDLAEAICRGGWPGSLGEDLPAARRFVRNYLNEIRFADLNRVSERRRDPTRALRLLRSLARNIGTAVAVRTLAADIGIGTTPRTAAEYLDDLVRLFVIEDLPAFSPHLRSRSRLRTTPKRYLTDPSLATAALGASPGELLRDLPYLGFLFEALVVRDLRVYAQAHDAELSHYRDNTGLEVDVIIETAQGGWMPVEIKLGGAARIDQAARNLLRLKERVDTARVGDPPKLVVVTGTGYGYERPDGVTVVPVGSLAP